MEKDPFEYLAHVGGEKTKDFGVFLSWLSDEEKAIAIERDRRFMEETGETYDWDAFFKTIPEENFKRFWCELGLLSDEPEKVASAVKKSDAGEVSIKNQKK
jgi:hypothetical protein